MDKDRTISRGQIVVNLALVLVLGLNWISICIKNPELIAWYDNGLPSVPIFYESLLMEFVPFWIVAMLSRVLALSTKLAYGKWTIVATIATMFSHTITALFLLFFLFQDEIVTDAFLERMVLLKPSLRTTIHIWESAIIWALIAIVVISFIMVMGRSTKRLIALIYN